MTQKTIFYNKIINNLKIENNYNGRGRGRGVLLFSMFSYLLSSFLKVFLGFSSISQAKIKKIQVLVKINVFLTRKFWCTADGKKKTLLIAALACRRHKNTRRKTPPEIQNLEKLGFRLVFPHFSPLEPLFFIFDLKKFAFQGLDFLSNNFLIVV